MSTNIKILSYPLGDLETNAYVVKNDQCFFVIDAPQGAMDACFKPFLKEGLNCVGLFITHPHFDHILDLPLLAHDYPSLPVYGSKICQEWVSNNDTYAWGGYDELDYVDELKDRLKVVSANESIRLLDIDWHLLGSEGHCPGSLSLYSSILKATFVGDLIFRQTVGRTDLPGGDMSLLKKNILEKIYTLEEETTLYPGHGPLTSVSYEKNHNSVVRF